MTMRFRRQHHQTQIQSGCRFQRHVYATFEFEVHDGTVYNAAKRTMTVNVTAVNDPPVVADKTVTAFEDQVFTFATVDFSNTENDTLVKSALRATAGALWVDTDGSNALDNGETAIVINDEVTPPTLPSPSSSVPLMPQVPPTPPSPRSQ